MPKDTSQRNTGRPQAEALNTTGLYSLVRHPLYVGNYLMWLGVALFTGAWWAPVIVSLVFWLYYERIMFAEEEFLRRRFGGDYTAWASTVPAFLPRLRGWRSPLTRFSLLTVLRREHSSLLALVASLTALKVVSDHAVTGRLTLDPRWGTALAATLLAVSGDSHPEAPHQAPPRGRPLKRPCPGRPSGRPPNPMSAFSSSSCVPSTTRTGPRRCVVMPRRRRSAGCSTPRIAGWCG